MQYIFRRGKWFHYKRRIPNLFRDFYDNDIVQVSLKTDSETIAQQRAAILNNELEKIWHQVATGAQEKSDDQFKQAVLIARLGGFTYRPASEIAKGDIGNIVSRIEAIKNDVGETPDRIEAILGKHDIPDLPVSTVLLDYFDFEQPNLLNKSEDQIRKWKNPRKKSIDNFIRICGDKDVSEITRNDILQFREWWYERIKSEGLTANSSNKDFSYLAQVLNYARDDKKIDLDVNSLLARVRFTETASTRPPFEAEYIQLSP